MSNTSTPYTEPDTPIEVFGESPSSATVPFWLVACVRITPPEGSSAKADKVLTAAAALLAARLKTGGSEDVQLDRAGLGLLCGYTGAQAGKKVGWLISYLESVGFAVVTPNAGTPGRGRERDTIRVFEQPPPAYAGPRTLAELLRALQDPTHPGELFVGNPRNRSSARRFPTENLGHDQGSELGTKVDVSPGQPEGSELGTKVVDLGSELGTKVDVSPGQPEGSELGTFPRARRSDRSLLSSVEERRGEIEPVPGGTAEPPATGQDEIRADAYDLARRLPWTAWGEKSGRQVRRGEVRDVAVAMSRALDAGRVTLDEAEHVAVHALSHANQPSYVVKAFKLGTIDRWLPAADIAPVEQQLSLPTPSTTSTKSGPGQQGQSVASAPVVLSEAERLPACDVEDGCGQPAGTPLAERDVPDPNDDRSAVRCACQGPIRERLKHTYAA